MKSGRGILRVFDSAIDRVLCVTGAVLFSQAPEFMQQYFQRLGGHLEEAQLQLEVFQKTATHAGLSLGNYISKIGSSPDLAVARIANVMRDSVERVATLSSAHEALLQARTWERPFTFLRHLDIDIARATGAVYKPAVPTTAEGLAYALAGMVFALVCYHWVMKRCIALLQSSRASPSPPDEAI